MKKRSKFLAWLLAAVLAITMLPAAAFAEGESALPVEVDEDAIFWDPESAALSFNGEAGQEYAIAEYSGGTLDWSNAVEPDGEGMVNFSGLEYATTYCVFTRIVDGDGGAAMTYFSTGFKSITFDAGEGGFAVGNTIKVNVQPAGDYHYLWRRSDEEHIYSISGATDPSYTLTEEDAGCRMSVLVYTKNYSNSDLAESDTLVFTAPQIAGCASGKIDVQGRKGQKYLIKPYGQVPAASDWSSAMKLSQDMLVEFDELTPGTAYDVFTRAGDVDLKTSAATLTDLNLSEPLEGLTVGSTLSVSPDPANDGLTYQWYVDKIYDRGDSVYHNPVEIFGADSASYTVTDYEAGEYLAVKAFANGIEVSSIDQIGPVAKAEGAPYVFASHSSAQIPSDESYGNPVGNEYTVALKGQEPDWSAAKVLEGRGDENTLKFDGLSSGTEYVAYTRADSSAAIYSEPFATELYNCSVSLLGDAYVYVPGETVQFKAYADEDAEVEVTGLNYQWFWESKYENASGNIDYSLTPIAGATSATYTIKDSDIGRTLAVRAYAGTQMVYQYDELGTVEARFVPAVPEPTYVYGIVSDYDEEGNFTGKSVMVDGNMNQAYVLTLKGEEPVWDWETEGAVYWPDEEGGYVEFTGLDAATEYTVHTCIPGDDQVVSTDFVTGIESASIDHENFIVGTSISVTPEPEGMDVEYQWCYQVDTEIVAGDNEGTTRSDYFPISGATGSTYDLTEDDVDKTIVLKIRKGSEDIYISEGFGPVTATATVEFDTDGGSEIESPEGLKLGDLVPRPQDPVKSGYTFLGWYHWVGEDEVLWDFDNDTVDSGWMSITAKWQQNYVPAPAVEEPAETTPAAIETPSAVRFIDVPETAWYSKAVDHCADKGYFNGVDEHIFAPGADMSRAMFAEVLYRMAGEPAFSGSNGFSDVENGKWYTDAVIWASKEGFIKGYGDSEFGPEDPITREQLVTVLYRFAQNMGLDVSIGEDTNILSYSDAFDIAEWARPAMQWAVGSGVIKGRAEGMLCPKDAASRAEVAQFILNYDTEAEKQ